MTGSSQINSSENKERNRELDPSSNLGPAPRFSHWIKAGASAGSSDPSLGLSAGDQKQMFQQRRGDESGANIWTSSVEAAVPVNTR